MEPEIRSQAKAPPQSSLHVSSAACSAALRARPWQVGACSAQRWMSPWARSPGPQLRVKEQRGRGGWPGSKPDSPAAAGALETALAAAKTFLRFLPGQWPRGLLSGFGERKADRGRGGGLQLRGASLPE